MRFAIRIVRDWCWQGVLLLGLLAASASNLPAAQPLDQSPEAIQQRLRASVEYLASDELEGRGLGTRGLVRAGDYIAEQFELTGLNTKQYSGTPFHTFYLGTRYELGDENEIRVQGPGDFAADWKLQTDFQTLSLSGTGEFDLPLAFVGYGISSRDHDYDDYAGLDVRGHAVVILRHEPGRNDVNSPFEGATNSSSGTLSYKINNALAHEVAAIILLNDRFELQDSHGAAVPDQLLPFQVQSTAGNRKVPVIHARRETISQIVQAVSGKSLSELEQAIDQDFKPHSLLLSDYHVQGKVGLKRAGQPQRNVVGVWQGQGAAKEETVIVGAHYDHLGRGGAGSLAFSSRGEIHNGADDNASGTSVMLEIARQIAARPERLKRRVVFIAFTAEESGLIGSERYVRDPLVPLSQTVAMLNLDMVGRLRAEKLTVYGTGTAVEFDKLTDTLGAAHKFEIIKKKGGYGPSDHASFYGRGIPVLHYFTGLHREYHRPEDDAPLLNYAGMQRISQLVAEAVVSIADTDQRPTMLKTNEENDLEEMAELMLGPELANAFAPRPIPGKDSTKVFLGVVRDPGYQGAGYAVQRVQPGSSAEKAGIHAGDIITHFGKEPIEKQSDLTDRLQKLKPDDKVVLQLRRNDLELELTVTLGSR